MKTMLRKMAVALGLVLIGTVLTAKASAECLSYLPGHKAGAVVSPQSWSGAEFSSASLVLASEHDSNDAIVGFWKVTFTAEGNGKEGPPDDTQIDSGYVQWHSDGTEIMNSGRPPQNGDFCLGVWEKTGRSRYKLNHFALGNVIEDPTNPTVIGPPGGPTQIVEDIILSRDGNHYVGTFTLDAYDTNHALLPGGHIIGVITATRITIHTPVTSVF